MKKVLRFIVTVLNWVVIGAIVLAYLAPFINPQTSWLIAFLGLSFKAWIVTLIVFTFLGFLLKTKVLGKNAFIIAIGIPFILRLVSIHAQPTETGNFKVVSFNTYALGQYEGLNTSAEIQSYLTAKSVDCAALIEYRFKKGNIDKKHYPFQVKIRTHPSSDNGILLVSKRRVVGSGSVPFTHGTYNMAGYIDVDFDGQIIRIYGIHLETTRVKPRDFHNLKRMDFDSTYSENAKNVAQRLKMSMEIRASQVEDIKAHMKDCKHPIIIMGDFNDTPQSYTYQQLKKDKRDAFVVAGKGFDATFLKPFPFLRIDYILADDAITPVHYSSTDSIYSDHKLIFADLYIK
ncbi:MAG: endonuclease/exonuclease/phosphatase family metal-dependent hydrolase [Bacteroidia bacterium]